MLLDPLNPNPKRLVASAIDVFSLLLRHLDNIALISGEFTLLIEELDAKLERLRGTIDVIHLLKMTSNISIACILDHMNQYHRFVRSKHPELSFDIVFGIDILDELRFRGHLMSQIRAEIVSACRRNPQCKTASN
jgi:hypothetical protein